MSRVLNIKDQHMGQITEFKLRAVITSTGQVLEGVHAIPDYQEMKNEGMSESEIKAVVMNDWLATQVAVEAVTRL